MSNWNEKIVDKSRVDQTAFDNPEPDPQFVHMLNPHCNLIVSVVFALYMYIACYATVLVYIHKQVPGWRCCLLLLVTMLACSCKPLHCVIPVSDSRHRHDSSCWSACVGRPAHCYVVAMHMSIFIFTIAWLDVLTQLYQVWKYYIMRPNAISYSQECYIVRPTVLYLSVCILGANSHVHWNQWTLRKQSIQSKHSSHDRELFHASKIKSHWQCSFIQILLL